MVTQKDIHNEIVENTTLSQKAYLALQCQIHDISVEEMEQSITNIVNALVSITIDAIENENMRYLCKRME